MVLNSKNKEIFNYYEQAAKDNDIDLFEKMLQNPTDEYFCKWYVVYEAVKEGNDKIVETIIKARKGSKIHQNSVLGKKEKIEEK